MNDSLLQFTVDGQTVTAHAGETILKACDRQGIYIPRLCYHPDLPPGGHCRMCTCKINGRFAATCVTPVIAGMKVENQTPELQHDRRMILEMLFVEGNHICPTCEKSGNCELQALGYRLGMDATRLAFRWPKRELDASHPDVLIDRDRCILCCRCVRASKTEDGKAVFSLEGRGIDSHIAVDALTGLGSTNFLETDKSTQVCPVGCILPKHHSYEQPVGNRVYDRHLIGFEVEQKKLPSPEPLGGQS
ncbi:(2Fe-2S)-binding protein [Telmatocola sphagniphila]|uniref:(2Fe-2S)-binding protein n=1 Tax=Telmatocola sphagniphila TaxID=1123043 RepID=A0A8E6BAP9_9BACT|nr:2Fe-2S iron-sulfur cluster-binding protein [Telmatocola sphagniphila]QVL33515.1 (2Fe-2S)-binding protein [Telmatocola sphagniphila]